MLFLALMGTAQKTTDMNTEKWNIVETVTQLFVATDSSNWQKLQAVLADSVQLDYSSMNNQPASMTSPTEIIEQWSAVLPGFDFTHHQLGNFMVEINGETAHCFCYGTATHYLESDEGNIWTVVGSYDFDLQKENNQWIITAIRFNYKYQSGNAKLVSMAIENQQEK